MTSSVTILLFDDEPLLRRATALILTRYGGQVTATGTADEAVALACERVYDVAVFDVSQTSLRATEVLRRIRAGGGMVPRRVIVVSSAPLDGRDAEELAAVLPKPYPFESLLRAVFSAEGRSRTRSGVFACAALRAQAVRQGFGGGSRAGGWPRDRLTAQGTKGAPRAYRGPGG
jgi:CheY-like chemotaxis protein